LGRGQRTTQEGHHNLSTVKEGTKVFAAYHRYPRMDK
jgi:hypothetical protein